MGSIYSALDATREREAPGVNVPTAVQESSEPATSEPKSHLQRQSLRTRRLVLAGAGLLNVGDTSSAARQITRGTEAHRTWRRSAESHAYWPF